MDEIKFYYEYEPNGFLSNFYPSTIHLEGRDWPTVEHYYQACKTFDPVYAEKVRTAASADEAKRLGNDPACALRPGWDEYKVEVMRRALSAKFGRGTELRAMLLATGNAILAENSRKDYYWGIGADGSGKNMLGKLLMELRESIITGRE